jgi:hypothetical protein
MAAPIPAIRLSPADRALGGVLYAMLDKFLLCVVILVLLVVIAIICVPHFQDWLLQRI